MRILTLTAALLALAACQQKAAQQPTTNEASASREGVGVKGVHRDHKGEVALTGIFADPDGNRLIVYAENRPAD